MINRQINELSIDERKSFLCRLTLTEVVCIVYSTFCSRFTTYSLTYSPFICGVFDAEGGGGGGGWGMFVA